MAKAKAIPYAIWGGSEFVGSSAMSFTESNDRKPPFQRIESTACKSLTSTHDQGKWFQKQNEREGNQEHRRVVIDVSQPWPF